MVDMNMIIAKNISSALRNAGKKQYELADAMGYSKQIVSNHLRMTAESCTDRIKFRKTRP